MTPPPVTERAVTRPVGADPVLTQPAPTRATPAHPTPAPAAPTHPLGHPDPGESARVLLVGKPGCHLCDLARPVVAAVCAELGVCWAEASILDDARLADLYWEQIPVTIVDGRVLDIWHVDEARLRAALG